MDLKECLAKTDGNFATFQNWVNHASRRIDGDAICFDSKGRRCRIGKDFMRADTEGTFPVYYTWNKLVAHNCMELLSAIIAKGE